MNQHALDVLEYDKIRELLVGYAASGLGIRLAQEIQPLTDLHRIERLIAETTELKRLLSPDRYLPLGGLHDLSPILEKLDKGAEILIIEEIMHVKETLRAFRIVKGYLEDAKGDYPHLRRLAGSIRLYSEIDAKIENTLNENGAVKSSASPELKSIRKTIQAVKGRIQRQAAINPPLKKCQSIFTRSDHTRAQGATCDCRERARRVPCPRRGEG